jgi:protein involved in polysaccharide export with SLBB domain
MKSNLFIKACRCGLLAALCMVGGVSLKAQQASNASAVTSPTMAPTVGASEDSPSTGASSDQYRIGARDVLTIRVTAPDIIQQFSSDAMEVNECGMIPLLSVQNEERNEVRAAGLTTNELQEQLRKFYMKYKRNPQVVVKVREYNSQPVAINGAVVKPGQFQLRRQVRLLELVQFHAGGPTEKAGGRVQIARMPALGMCESRPASPSAAATATVINDASAPSFLIFSLADTLKGDERANPLLQPGDVITLPEASEAYVIGNVPRPGPVMLKNDKLTVSRAIAMVGGPMSDTKMGSVRIIRQDANGANRQEIPVDLAAINKHKAEDIALQPNDIIDVPTSGGKRLLRSLVGTIAPAVGQLPVRVIP